MRFRFLSRVMTNRYKYVRQGSRRPPRPSLPLTPRRGSVDRAAPQRIFRQSHHQPRSSKQTPASSHTGQQTAQMEEFRFLLFRFPDERSEEFFDALDVSLPEGWWREHETEKRVRDAKSDAGKFYCYGCGKSSAHGAAALIVSRLDAQNYAVANLLPREPGMLMYEQYNAVLTEFHQRVLLKIKTAVPVSFVLRSGRPAN